MKAKLRTIGRAGILLAIAYCLWQAPMLTLPLAIAVALLTLLVVDMWRGGA